MEILKEILPYIIHASLALIVFSIGLNASMDEALYVLKRPVLIFKALISVSIIVPLVAIVIVLYMPLPRIVKFGIVLMAVSPLPPFVIGKAVKLGGRKHYVHGLLVAIALCSILVVPLSVAVLNVIFPSDASISPLAVAKLVLISTLLPAGVGMTCRHIAPASCDRMAPVVSKFAVLLLLIAAVPILVKIWPAVWQLIGDGTVLAIAAVVLTGLISGHLIGGEKPPDKITLAIISSTRHPGIAILIAHENTIDKGITAAILLFVITGFLLSIPYQFWCKRHMEFMEVQQNVRSKSS